MHIYTKSLLLTLTLSLSIMAKQAASQPEDYESGKTKITNIMSNEQTGVAAHSKDLHFAETANLDKDLNIAAIAEFFGCKTLIGKTFLTETLKTPLNPQDKNTVLAQRRAAIQVLVDNPELKKQVEKILEAAKTDEQEVIKLLSDYFIGQSCPELKNLEVIKEQNPGMYPFLKFLTMNPTGKNIALGMNLLSAFGTVAMTVTSAYSMYHGVRHNVDITSGIFGTAYFGLCAGLVHYQLYKDYERGSDKRIKMHSLYELVATSEVLEKLCKRYSVTTQFKSSEIKNAHGLEIIEKLKHPRYKAKKTLFFKIPSVHAFLYQIYQEQQHLAEVFASIAEMDAYNAIATKIIESKKSSNKFCFVNFIDDAQPIVHAKNFWNVLVNNAVSNNLSEHRSIILTGPNAGGKTTSIRAVLQNIVLGQSFGVAAAETFEFTMFDVIHSYLNISDDLINGLSLFASEVKRAQGIVQKIKSLDTNKKFFFALDELFTGTVSEDGEVCAYEFVNKISKPTNVQFVYATHFNKLKELAKDNASCANYKVDAPTKNAQGKLVYPFTLSAGANEARVALDIAKEANLFD